MNKLTETKAKTTNYTLIQNARKVMVIKRRTIVRRVNVKMGKRVKEGQRMEERNGKQTNVVGGAINLMN